MCLRYPLIVFSSNLGQFLSHVWSRVLSIFYWWLRGRCKFKTKWASRCGGRVWSRVDGRSSVAGYGENRRGLGGGASVILFFYSLSLAKVF